MVAIVQLAVDIYSRDQRIASPEWERVRSDVLPELGLSEEALPEFVDIVLERFGCAVEA